jgi:hypothetical protein
MTIGKFCIEVFGNFSVPTENERKIAIRDRNIYRFLIEFEMPYKKFNTIYKTFPTVMIKLTRFDISFS